MIIYQLLVLDYDFMDKDIIKEINMLLPVNFCKQVAI